MTTNDATTREAITDAVAESAEQRHMKDEAGQWDWFYCIDPDTTADAMIAHIWRMADDPAVVEAVVLSGMLFPERASEPEMKQQRVLAAGWILRVLTALLGPRPQESDDG